MLTTTHRARRQVMAEAAVDATFSQVTTMAGGATRRSAA